jgi:hypothetical protein
VLVIDRSGSMEESVGGSARTKLDLAVEAASLAVSTLFPQDLVGVAAFDDAASWVVEVQPNSDARSITRLIRSIQPGGGTNIYAGLELAQRRIQNMTVQDAAVRHVILLTDGISEEPTVGAYNRLVGELLAAGVTLSTVGVGDGHDQALLARLAAIGGGQYHPVLEPDRLPQVFIKEAKTIRKNLIREGLFEPQVAQFSPVLTGLGAAAAPGVRAHGPEAAPARDDGARWAGRGADLCPLASRPRSHRGVHERRDKPLGHALAAVAGVRGLLGTHCPPHRTAGGDARRRPRRDRRGRPSARPPGRRERGRPALGSHGFRELPARAWQRAAARWQYAGNRAVADGAGRL